MKVETVADFSSYIESVENKPGYQRPKAFALGVKRKRGDVTLDVTYPIINFEESYGTAAVIADKPAIPVIYTTQEILFLTDTMHCLNMRQHEL